MIELDFTKKYVTGDEADALHRNPEYQQWVKEGKRCPVCGSDGEEAGTFRFLGEEHECPQQHIHVATTKAKLYWSCNIPYQYQILPPFGLNNSDFDGVREQLDEYLELFEGFYRAGMGLTFFSKLNGTGKTWAATWVLKELAKRGKTCWFAPFYDVKGYFERPPQEREWKQNKVRNSGVLVLDEVIPPISSAQADLFSDKLEYLIRPRQDMNFPTIITTNMTMEELDQHYPRVFSLLSAKNIEIPMPQTSDARKAEVFFRNLDVIRNGETWPIT